MDKTLNELYEMTYHLSIVVVYTAKYALLCSNLAFQQQAIWHYTLLRDSE